MDSSSQLFVLLFCTNLLTKFMLVDSVSIPIFTVIVTSAPPSRPTTTSSPITTQKSTVMTTVKVTSATSTTLHKTSLTTTPTTKATMPVLKATTSKSEATTITIPTTTYDDNSDSQEWAYAECRPFANDDPSPWWQIDLQDRYFVFKISVHDIEMSSKEKLSVQVRVGFTDLTKVKAEDILKVNRLCLSFISRGRIYDMSRYCSYEMVGRYVSIHMFEVKAKVPLTACNFHIWGRPIHEETFKDYARVLQSSTLNGIDPRLIIDGNKATDYTRIERELQCLQLKSNKEIPSPFLEINLEKIHVLEKIVIYSVDLDEDFSDHYRVQVSVQNVTANSSGESTKDTSQTQCVRNRIMSKDKNDYVCPPKLKGKYVVIRLIPKCEESQDCEAVAPLNIGEVEIWGYEETKEMEEVAHLKPTNQSSTVHGGESHLAVDNVHSVIFYAGMTTKCTHTNGYEGKDLYPWWRVDLTRIHYVQGLSIINRGETLHSRLHDVVIRVGNKDIEQIYDMVVVFEENAICKSFPNQIFTYGTTKFNCDTPLIGQYVSIQIVKTCDLYLCHSTKMNFLTLCEVDVIGYPLVIKRVENVALNRSVTVSQAVDEMNNEDKVKDGSFNPWKDKLDNPTSKEMEDAFRYPWWKIDLTDVYVVESVILNLGWFKYKVPSQLIAVHVGPSDIASDQNRTFFEGNPICVISRQRIKVNSTLTLTCVQQKHGRYVSVQIIDLCNKVHCTLTILPIKDIAVMGYKMERFYNAKNIATGKNSMSNINTELSYLTNDGKMPNVLHIPKAIPQCTSTRDQMYPWIHLRFNKFITVSSVIIYNVAGEKSKFLHDIEVKFYGMTDVPYHHSTEPFRFGDLCVGVYGSSLPEGENVLNCSDAVRGTAATVQIVRPCSSETCGQGNSNRLIICEIEIIHLDSEWYRREMISADKPIKQSSYNLTGGDSSSMEIDDY